ncbi:MAG: hypothetical protein E6Q33_01425 [Neisseriales bacterium]|nr:MAG: hypothetical protein E6Q33_01425 [Neisseriales bacterium]
MKISKLVLLLIFINSFGNKIKRINDLNKIDVFHWDAEVTHCVGMTGQITNRVGKFLFDKSSSFLASRFSSSSLGFLGKMTLPYFFPVAGTLLPLALTESTFLFGLKENGLVDRYLPFILAGTGFALVSQKPYMAGTFMAAMYLYYRKKKNKQAEELKIKFDSEKADEIKKINYKHEEEKEKLSNTAEQEKNNLIENYKNEKIALENSLKKLHEEEKLLLMSQHEKEMANRAVRIESLLLELRTREDYAKELTDQEKEQNEKTIKRLSEEIIELKNKQKILETGKKPKRKSKGIFNYLLTGSDSEESDSD